MEPHRSGTAPSRPGHVPFPDPADMPGLLVLLEAAVRRAPGGVAVCAPEGSVGFDAFWAAIRRLAAAVAATGHDGRPVAVLLPPGPDYVVAIFACLAAGRVSLLLDASYPDARNAELAAACGCRLAVTVAGGAVTWPWVASLSVGDGSAPSPLRSPVPPGLDEPAFILATSGSTGRPKAIVHSQRTMFHWARTIHDALGIAVSDRVLSLSSPSTLGGLTGLLGYPLAGASVEMLDLKRAGLSGLLATLRAQPVTILRAAPSVVRGLARLPDAVAAFARLRVVQTYGEPLTRADVADMRRVLPPACRVRSTYGATECSGLSWFASPDDPYDPVRIPAGLPMPDTVVALLDDSGRPVPPGEAGELVIRSRYNALGEWVDGAVVPGRLLPDPERPGFTRYATGDLAAVHADGTVVVFGRKDRMLNINGQRVEPAEVEAALRTAPGVVRAEVVADLAAQPHRLLAFAVAAPGADTVRRLTEHVRTRLPAHMVPSRILLLDEIPLLPGGKVDAAALLALAARPVSLGA